MNIIESIRNSDELLAKNYKEDVRKWKNLNHTKKDLEFFLQFNIAELFFKTKDNKLRDIICTSNQKFISIFNAKSKVQKKQILTTSYGRNTFNTNDPFSINTYDLSDNKIKTVRLSFWQIVDFISIRAENISIIDTVVKNLLKK